MLRLRPQPGYPTSRGGGHRGSDRDSLLSFTLRRGQATCQGLETGVEDAAGHGLKSFHVFVAGGWCKVRAKLRASDVS